MIIKRTLHDTLLNLKCLPTNNSKDDDNIMDMKIVMNNNIN